MKVGDKPTIECIEQSQKICKALLDANQFAFQPKLRPWGFLK